VRLLIEHGAPDSLKRTPLYLLSRPPAATDIAESLDDIAHSVDNLRKAGFENLFCCLAVTQCVELHGAYSFLKRELGIGTVAALSPGGEGLHTLVRGALHIGSLFYDALADVVLLMPGKKGTLSRHDITGLLQIAKGALSPLGRYPASYTLVSCPMCGRCEIDITGMTQDVDRLLSSTEKEYRDRGISLAALGGISVAVMGCNVNGPGEARGADIGIAGGRAGSGTIFLKGSVYETLPEAALLPRFKTLLHTLIDEKANAT
jgi:(E)-4-hydroxy-3-methylbut-2-enyl-diphosphate synthase